MAIAVLFAVLASSGVHRRQRGIEEARVAAQRLLDVQAVRVAIVAADSIASSNYLRGGLERSEARIAFDNNIRQASAGLANAREGLDAAASESLSAASADLTEYTGLIEQARANNRQGFPVGAAYQRQANALITTSTLPLLDGIESSLRGQVNDKMSAAGLASVWYYLALVVMLATLIVGLWWLSKRFKRLINLPLGVALAVVVVLGIVGMVITASSMSDANRAVERNLRHADLSAQVRAAMFDARSQEALTLINRGNGAAFERSWANSQATAELAGERSCPRDCPLPEALAAYGAAHAAMRAVDDRGDWEVAVNQALGDADVDGTNLVTAFNHADAVATDQLQANVRQADAALADAAAPLGGLRWFLIVAGLAVAVLAVVGYGQRSREYR